MAEGTNLENYDYPENSGMVKSGSGHSVRSRRSFCNSCTIQVGKSDSVSEQNSA